MSQQDDTRPRKTGSPRLSSLLAAGRGLFRERMQSFASVLRDAVTAVEDTWRVNIRGVGSLKKRGTSSGPRSFVKSSPACSLFESLIKEVAVSRLIFYAPSSTFIRSLSLSLVSLFFLFLFFYRNLCYLNENSNMNFFITKIYHLSIFSMRMKKFYFLSLS